LNPITSIASLSGDLLILVIAGLVFIEESGIPVPFAPGDLLLMVAGIAIASDTVDAVPMVSALLVATILGAMIGREVFAAVGRPALMRVAEALRFRPALERATHLLRRGGAPAVFAGRLIPGLRIHTTQVAGVSKMPRRIFALGLIPSVFVYIAIFVGLGALVGQPAVSLFHRAEHRFFVIAVTVLAALAVILSVRWLARRGGLSALEPIVLGVRRDLADQVEATIFRRGDEPSWRQYPLVRRLWAGLIDLAMVFAVAILILTAISGALCAKDFRGRRILITAGPTQEPLDPVRFLSNRSSGKMGWALAEAARDRGATVLGGVDRGSAIVGPGSVAAVQLWERDLFQRPGHHQRHDRPDHGQADPDGYRHRHHHRQGQRQQPGDAHVHLDDQVTRRMGIRRRADRVRAGADAGMTMIEVTVTMVVMAVVMSVFTTAIVGMLRSANHLRLRSASASLRASTACSRVTVRVSGWLCLCPWSCPWS